jgi:transposase
VTRPAYVRQLAAEMELLGYGSTQAFNPAGGGTEPDSRAPTGESSPMHERFVADWDRRGDACLKFWHEQFLAWKGGGKVRPAGVSEREIVLTDGEGFSPDDVAMRYRLTATMVRRWRVQDERDGETGVPLAKVRERVRALRAQDLSYRQIAERLGRSKSQVERVDKERAA